MTQRTRRGLAMFSVVIGLAGLTSLGLFGGAVFLMGC